MKNVSIIGAGQLGSRHLQGLMTSLNEMEIWVIDASEESLKVAKERCDAVKCVTPKNVHYELNINSLPRHLDLVIVATGSKPRSSIIRILLEHSIVENLVLEKFLFTKLIEYDEIANLLTEKKVKCWVNCPRRMWSAYEEIKKIINPDVPVIMENSGKDWGMCCNSVHSVDVWMFLAGDCAFTVDMSKVEPRILCSKRAGYIELLGKEHFVSDNGDELTLGSYAEYDGESNRIIKNDNNTIVVNEAEGLWYLNGVKHENQTPFQSSLTGILADEILNTGNCRLSPYSISVMYHKPYLKAVLDFVNKIQGVENDSCPIT